MILRPSRLADALAARTISEQQKFQYLLLWAVGGVLLQAGGSASNSTEWPRLTFVTLNLLITLVGLVACFRANVQGDNHAFLERYLCLSVPVGLTMYGLYFLLYYAAALFAFLAGWIDRDAHGWNRNVVSLSASMLALSTYYAWMRQLMQRAAGIRVV